MSEGAGRVDGVGANIVVDCPSCGRAGARSLFCSECGRSLTDAPASPRSSWAAGDEPDSAKKQLDELRTIRILMMAVILAVLIVGAMWLAHSRIQHDQNVGKRNFNRWACLNVDHNPPEYCANLYP
jgi:uncharacterized membrane protein YvbJ